VRGASTLTSLVACLKGEASWPAVPQLSPPALSPPPDLSDVRGQDVGRAAVEVAAAGGHHLLFSGPPGAGKTMLARRLPGLLPPLERDDSLVATRVHSAAGLPLPEGLVTRAPFRAPHHGASLVSLIGGGSGWMRPGEVSLSHAGVLFLDEMGEFPTAVLDSLRQPLEDGVVRICRAKASVSFPARFLLVGATNPCPCGRGDDGACRCSSVSRARYVRRFSGPLLDRFDLRVVVSKPDVDELLRGGGGETTATVAERVAEARRRARERGVRCNAELPARLLDHSVPLTPAASSLLEHKLRTNGLSARGLHRVKRVARTLADLAGEGDVVGEEHVCLALGLRAEPRLGEETW
jgi:magnesium chelatase family protein